jgi:hypothetical protein
MGRWPQPRLQGFAFDLLEFREALHGSAQSGPFV